MNKREWNADGDKDGCAWMAVWIAAVLLAMESHDRTTGLVFDAERVPENQSTLLKNACRTGAVTVTVPDPEPYTRLTKTVQGVVLHRIRGVWDRPASWARK